MRKAHGGRALRSRKVVAAGLAAGIAALSLVSAAPAHADKPRELQLRWHPEQTQHRRDGNAMLFAGKQATLRLEPLTTEATRIDAAELPCEGRHGEKDQTMFAVQMIRNTAHWRNAVALSWVAAGGEAKVVTLDAKDPTWRFQAGDRVVPLDWTAEP